MKIDVELHKHSHGRVRCSRLARFSEVQYSTFPHFASLTGKVGNTGRLNNLTAETELPGGHLDTTY